MQEAYRLHIKAARGTYLQHSRPSWVKRDRSSLACAFVPLAQFLNYVPQRGDKLYVVNVVNPDFTALAPRASQGSAINSASRRYHPDCGFELSAGAGYRYIPSTMC